MRTYQAYTMAEALAAVKRDLGPDAVILSTRSVQKGGILGLGRKSIVEVTATPAQTPAQPSRARSGPPASRIGSAESASARSLSPRAGSARKAYAAAIPDRAGTPRGSATEEDDGALTPHEMEADRERTRRLAQAMLVRHEKRQADEKARQAQPGPDSSPSPAEMSGTGRARSTQPTAEDLFSHIPARAGDEAADPQSGEPVRNDHPPKATSAAGANGDAASNASSAGREHAGREVNGAETPRRFLLRAVNEEESDGSAPSRPVRAEAAREKKPAGTQSSPRRYPRHHQPLPAVLDVKPSGPADGVDRDRIMQDELVAIRQMVGQVLEGQSRVSSTTAPPKMPARLFDFYLKLIGQDLSEELADQIINAVRDELTATQLEDSEEIRAAVLRHLADDIPVADQAVAGQSPDDRPLTIALVGPTGVGKTTTLAKIAASFKLRHHRKVGLITSDTYRIAAVDQLRTYANIIGLPLRVVLTPGEMKQAVASLQDCDVILIDTAGRSQNDSGRIDELKQFINAAAPHETHLVLSSTASEKVLLREAEAFGVVGIHKIVLTKLDEAVSFGMLVNVIRQVGKELSFVTNGQEVPDHIEVGRPERLAALILGEAEKRTSLEAPVAMAAGRAEGDEEAGVEEPR